MATLNISWTASAGGTGSYRIRFWDSTTPTQTYLRENVTGTSLSIPNLTTGRTYRGTIEAMCGDGTFAAPVSFTSTVPTP